MIAIIVGDTGAAADLVPTAQEIEARGVSVKWFADPNGRAKIDVLEKRGIPYSTVRPEEYDGSLPKVILCGTSSGYAGLQVAWTIFGKTQRPRMPVYWFEDLWGTGEQENERDADPDVMLVLDELASKIVLAKRPGIQTRVVRKPTFGKIPPLEDLPAIRRTTREALELSESDFLVSWGFQGEPNKMAPAHVGEIIREKLQLDDGMIVAWRLHPKHLRKDELWATLTASGIRFVPKARDVDLLNLYLSSDAVVVPFGGTDGYKAVLRGIPTITPVFPSGELARQLYDYDDEQARISSGFINGIPPLLTGDISWGAWSARHVLELLRQVRERPVSSRLVTLERSIPFQDLEKPGSAALIADEVVKYL